MNGILWNKSLAKRLSRIGLPSTAGLVFVNSFGILQYIFGLKVVLDGTNLSFIAGTLYDNTVFCATAKLPPHAFGYTSIVIQRMLAEPLAITGDNLPQLMLAGTR